MRNHLTLEERDRIAQLRHSGANGKEIAQRLQRSEATISRELDRNGSGGEYFAGQAQQQSDQRRRERPLERKMDDPQLNEFVRSGLAQEWSPQQIASRLEQQAGEPSISHQTIYAWIRQDQHRKHWEARLRRRGKRPCRLCAMQCRRTP